MTDAPPLSIRLLISWLTNALVLGVVAAVLSDVHVDSAGSLLLAAAVFGVLNTLFKPLLRLVTLPLAVITFGLAWFFVSMLMLVLTRALVSGLLHPRLLDAGVGDRDRLGREHGAGLHPGSVADRRQARPDQPDPRLAGCGGLSPRRPQQPSTPQASPSAPSTTPTGGLRWAQP